MIQFKFRSIRNRSIELGLIIAFTYIPLFLFEFSFNLIKQSNNSNREEKVTRKALEARSNGFLPFYAPKFTSNIKKGFYPLGGKLNTNTYLCDEGYGLVNYKSDRFGLRNNDKKWDLIKKSNIAFFVGDSFVHGSCVDDEKTISEVFEKKSGILSLNLGASGATPAHYKASIELLVKPLVNKYASINNSKNVYMVFYMNDNCRTCSLEGNAYQNLIKKNHPISFDKDKIIVNPNYSSNIKFITDKMEQSISSKTAKQKNLISRSLRLNSLRLRLSRFLYSLGLRKNYNNNDATQKAINSLSKICIKKCNAYTAYIPPAAKDNVLWSKRYEAHIKKMSDLYGVTYIDLSSVLNSQRESDYAPEGSHLSEEGYRKIAVYLIQNSR